MPYRRRYRRRRNYRRKPMPWYKKKYNALEIGAKALSGVRYLKGLVNSELYKVDLPVTTAATSSGAVDHLSRIAQGDGDNNRTGNSILCKGLYVRGDFTMHASATTTKIVAYLFRDKQQIGDSAPTITDLLTSADTESFLNPDTVGRFTVLKRKVIYLNTDRPQSRFECYLKMRHHIRYNGTASTDIQKGGLFLALVSDQATNTPSTDLNFRVSYHDN